MHYTNWLAAYDEYVAEDRTPSLFKRWAGVYILAAAIQRRRWIISNGKPIYPNLYVLFCGSSAAGKGVSLDPVYEILSRTNDQFIAPPSVTAAALVDEFEDSVITLLTPDHKSVMFNPLTVIANEFGVFIPAYDTVVLNLLTDLYDCKGYAERRRGNKKGRVDIPYAHLSIIGGTTPDYLNNVLPEGAWGEGFMSRMVLVYGHTPAKRELVEELENIDKTMQDNLVSDLNDIITRYGRMRWAPKGFAAINQWYMHDKSAPTHPKLITYNGRRHFNALKLSLLHAIARDADVIEEDDVAMAIDLLTETELYMPDAFKAMRTGGDQQVIKEARYFVFQTYINGKNKEAISHAALVRFLQDRAPAHAVTRMIDVMVDANLIKRVYNRGKPEYTPAGTLTD